MIDAAGSRLRVFCVGFVAAAGVWLAAAPGEAQARTRRVPERYATIQAAVDAADAGDVIDVAPGRHCGAPIDRPVTLRGNGRAVIVGCADGPALCERRARRLSSAGRGRRQRRQRHAASKASCSTGAASPRPTSSRWASAIIASVRQRRARRAQPHPRHRPGDHQHGRRSLGDRPQRDRRPDRVRLHRRAVRRRRRHRHPDRARPVAAPGGPARQPARTSSLGNVVNGAIPDGFGVFSMVGRVRVRRRPHRGQRATACRSPTTRTRKRSGRACWSTTRAADSRR